MVSNDNWNFHYSHHHHNCTLWPSLSSQSIFISSKNISSSSRLPSLMTMIIITIIWGNLREDVYRVNHGEALSASAKLLALCLYFCSNLYLCSNLYFCSNFIIIIRLWSYLNQITKYCVKPHNSLPSFVFIFVFEVDTLYIFIGVFVYLYL